MLGSIGGYIGMIMGLSIFHLPDIFSDFIKLWRKFRTTKQIKPITTTKLQITATLPSYGTDTIIETY